MKMSKKLIKLINGERINTRIASQKACTENATDICTHEDNAECAAFAYDYN